LREPQRQITTALPLRWKLLIAERCEGPEACVETKKKARRINDAPSNKTFGNCMLVLHCSQKKLAANRAVARLCVVAVRQHANPSTGYPQILVDGLGIVSVLRFRCENQQILWLQISDSSVRREQSSLRKSVCAITNLWTCW
jgi:hypothetical protein